jgi:hypothetical protein
MGSDDDRLADDDGYLILGPAGLIPLIPLMAATRWLHRDHPEHAAPAHERPWPG